MFGICGRKTIAAGQGSAVRLGGNAGVVLDSHGKYYEAVKAGRVFSAANQAAVAVTAAMSTTYTGLVVENPATSGKDLVMLEFGWSLSVVLPTALTVFGLMVGLDAGDAAAAITPKNMYLGGAGSVATVDNGCTLTGTPVLVKVCGNAAKGADTVTVLDGVSLVDLNGGLIVPPGYYVAVYSFAANTAAAIFSLMWEEVDV
ncbi:MAG: hypothetical protein LLG06_19780 [Desulfobacteraceae bacterium]|nr:hypothetical protein [Desulfobacteraceae bacterium]